MQKVRLGKVKNVHFIGIGGVSMSGLAEILKNDGYQVSGSDNQQTATTIRLQAAGIEVKTPNAAENIRKEHDLVVYTAAVKPDNPEFAAAREMDIPMMDRAALLAEITKGFPQLVCIAGSHGKTTTTGLFSSVAIEAGLDPTISIGGFMSGGANYRVGDSDCFILEACEYSNSFLQWFPYIGVILNVDADHIDFYGGMDGIIDSFARFAGNIHPSGALVIHAHTQGFERITAAAKCKVIPFGDGNLYYAHNTDFSDDGKPAFDVYNEGTFLTRVNLPLHGEFNMINALACFAAASQLGLGPETIKRGLEAAMGIKRRFEYKGMFNGAKIIDDYAHHPTEVKACLAAARKSHAGRIICVFQPHLYSRTRDLFDDFALSFSDADLIHFVPIYAAREKFDPSITVEMLGERVKGNGGSVECHCDLYTAETKFRDLLSPGDLLITMGAGDVHFIGERLL